MNKLKIAKMSDIGKVEGDYKALSEQLRAEFKRQHPKADPVKFEILEVTFKERMK